jgi:hypothetical protein
MLIFHQRPGNCTNPLCVVFCFAKKNTFPSPPGKKMKWTGFGKKHKVPKSIHFIKQLFVVHLLYVLQFNLLQGYWNPEMKN